MTTLYKREIPHSVCADYFGQYWDALKVDGKSKPVIEISTRQAFGRKTAIGLQVSLVLIEDCGDYQTKNFCMSVPCARIAFEIPVPPSRVKAFREQCFKAWQNYKAKENAVIHSEHPYYQAFESFCGVQS